MKGILKNVILVSSGRKADDSVKINFCTSIEQTSEEVKELDDLRKKSGLLYFVPNENTINQDIIKQLDNTFLDMPKQKSHSKRLMNVLFVLAKQQGYEDSFPEFYANRMERFISDIKKELE